MREFSIHAPYKEKDKNMDSIIALFQGMGIMHIEWGQAVMIIISLVLLWLAIARGFEPLLLLPIGFGGLLSNFLRQEWR